MLKLRFFSYLKAQISKTENKLAQVLTSSEADSKDGVSVFYIQKLYLNFKLIALTIFSDLIKFFIILTTDSSHSFNLIFSQKELNFCHYSYSNFKRVQIKVRTFSAVGLFTVVAVAVISSLVTNLIFGGKLPSYAATKGFVQNDWSGGTSTAFSAVSGWAKYESASSTLNLASSNIALNSFTSSTTHSSDTDFNSAVASSSTQVLGTGAAASVKLSNGALSMNNLAAAWNFNNNGNDVSGNNNNITAASVGLPNIISNPSFESGSTNWLLANGASTFNTMGAYGYVGRAAFRVDSTFTQNIVTNAGTVNFSYKTWADSWAFKNRSSVNGIICTVTLYVSQVTCTGSINVPASSSYPFMISLWRDDGGSNLNLDDITVTQGQPFYSSSSKLGVAAASAVTSNVFSTVAVALGASSTIAGWVNTGAGGSGIYKVITQNSSGLDQLVIQKSDNHLGLLVGNTTFRDSGYVVPGGWNHIVAVGNASSTQFYVNGDPVGSVPYQITSDVRYLGNAPNGASPLGSFDDVVVYRRALSANEVKVLALAGQEFSTSRVYYNPSGSYTSNVLDTGLAVASWGNLNWTNLSGQTIAVQAISNNIANPVDSRWANLTSCPSTTASSTNLSTLGGGCIREGDRYVRYLVTLSTTDTTQTPVLDDISLNYNQYYPSGTLISNPFNTDSYATVLAALDWYQTIGTSTTLKLQLATAPDSGSGTPGDWSSWLGPTSGSDFYTSNSIGLISNTISNEQANPINNQWFKYKITLESDGYQTPTLLGGSGKGIAITYVANEPPTLSNASAYQIATTTDPNWGKIAINYSVSDIDTDTDTGSINLITPSFAWSTNGSTWNTITGGFVTVNATSSKAVSSSTPAAYQVIWDPRSVISTDKIDNFQIRVSVWDGQAARGTSTAAVSNIILDSLAPTPNIQRLVVNTTNQGTVYPNAFDLSAIQFRIATTPTAFSNFSASDNAGWQNYLASTTLALAGDPTTMYVQYRDAYNNVSATSTAVTAQTPQSFMIQDTSNLKDGLVDYRLFFAWKAVDIHQPSADFAAYDIFRSVDNGLTFSLFGTIASSSINYFTDNNAPFSSPTYYYVMTRDANGNTSFSSPIISAQADGILNFGEGGGGTIPGGSELPPIIDEASIATSSIFTTQATINWTTNQPSDSLVYYKTTPGCDFTDAIAAGSATLRDQDNHFGRHSVTISSLAPNTAYYFQIRSAGNTGLIASSTCSGDGYGFTTATGPSITANSVNTASVTNTTATITWATDQAADSYVTFSTSSNLAGSIELGSSNQVTDHQVTLFGLTPGTLYYYYVKSANAIDDNASSFYVFSTTRDTTPPAITFNPLTDILFTDTTASILFTTSKVATTTVILTDGSFYTSLKFDNTLNASHRFDFSGLASSTTYTITIVARDENGNYATSSGSQFTTLAAPDTVSPVISTTTEMVVTDTDTAAIFWTTNEPANSYVQWNQSTTSFETEFKQQGQDESTTSHKVVIRNLKQGETYYFRLKSTDESKNTSHDPDLGTMVYFSFKAVPSPLTLVNISTSTVTDNMGLITWTTNHLANSRIDYGTSTGDYPLMQVNGSMTTEHAVVLNNLTPSTNYFFRVVSSDNLDQTATSGENILITQAAPVSTEDYQEKLEQIDSLQAQIDDLLNQLAQASTTSGDQVTALQNQIAELQNQILALQTELSLATSTANQVPTLREQIAELQNQILALQTELSLATSSAEQVIQLQAKVADLQKQLTEYTFTPSDYQARLNEITDLQARLSQTKQTSGGGVIFIDKTDKITPVISEVMVDNLKYDSSQIRWTTNELADGFVKYGTTTQYTNFVGYPDLNEKHLFILNDLLPSSIYHYQVISKDAWGNLAADNDRTFTTLSLTPEEQEEASTTEEQGKENISPELVKSAAEKMVDLLNGLLKVVSLGSFEGTLLSQYDSLDQFSKLLPGPVLSGEPVAEITPSTATLTWKTDKLSNSIVAFTPEVLFDVDKGAEAYIQRVGESNELTLNHKVKIVGLKFDTVYHYQLRSKAKVGPESSSRDFTFRTKPDELEIISANSKTISPTKAQFSWMSSQEATTQIIYTPYRDGKLNQDETKEILNKSLTVNHQITLNDLESGVVYQIDYGGTNLKGNKVNKIISFFSTSKDDLPPEIGNIQSESALSQGKDIRVQTAISWTTNEPTIGRIKYGKGALEDVDNLTELTPIEATYSRTHTAIITKFDVGQTYTFRIAVTDSGGKQAISSAHTILTPKQKESVFELILRTFESTFGWMGQVK